jgi:hypothetical protein
MSNIGYNLPEFATNAIGAGRPPLFKTPAELENRVIDYLKYCKDNAEPITMTGVCLFLGTYRDYLWSLEKDKPEFSDLIKRIREMVANSYEKGGITGSINAAQAIFLQKNAGFTDQQNINMNITGNLSLSQLATQAELMIQPEPEEE